MKIIPGHFSGMTISKVPNGAIAFLDENGKMLAYRRNGIFGPGNWDWIRKDYR